MTDMLVKLYELPDLHPALESQWVAGIDVRRVMAPEKHIVVDWVRETFGTPWASECEITYAHHPPSCFVAIQKGQLIGFACFDSIRRGYFGPTGVIEVARGQGTGKALLLLCLYDMVARGYGYAIIGGVGPVEFYSKAVGAQIIEESSPGVYRGMLRD
jgi:hypothetical protein